MEVGILAHTDCECLDYMTGRKAKFMSESNLMALHLLLHLKSLITAEVHSCERIVSAKHGFSVS